MDIVDVMVVYLPVVLVCTAQSREALCVLHRLERHCVYCTVKRGMSVLKHDIVKIIKYDTGHRSSP
jgi:hypothetical protein